MVKRQIKNNYYSHSYNIPSGNYYPINAAVMIEDANQKT